MFPAGVTLVSDLGHVIERDPEVRQARLIADAARTRLLASVSGPSDGIDLAEAQRMLDALRNAQAHATDAEDRVLEHRGLLTPAEAERRAAGRHLAASRADEPAPPSARRVRRAPLIAKFSRLRVAAALRPAMLRPAAAQPAPLRPIRRPTLAPLTAGALTLGLLGALLGATLAERHGTVSVIAGQLRHHLPRMTHDRSLTAR